MNEAAAAILELPEWWKPAGGGASGPHKANQPAWPKTFSTAHFSVEGRGGFLDVMEFEGDDAMSSIIRGARGSHRLTYEEARALADGLADHPGPLADEIAWAITEFLKGAET